MNLAEVRFAFGNLQKGHRFEYDPEVNSNVVALIDAGYIADVTPAPEVPAEETVEAEEETTTSVASTTRTKKG